MENETNEQKICRRCEKLHPLVDFRYGKSCCYGCQKLYANEWKAKNRQRVNAYNKEYKAEHREEISEYNSEYSRQNRAVIQERSSANWKRMYHENPSHKMAGTMRNRISKALKWNQKSASTMELLGCSMEFLKSWFAYCFSEDMNFDNHGSAWHIDHAIPCSKFNLIIADEQKKCFHWSNLKPMDPILNLSKNNSATKQEIEEHENKITSFLLEKENDFVSQYTIIQIDRFSYI